MVETLRQQRQIEDPVVSLLRTIKASPDGMTTREIMQFAEERGLEFGDDCDAIDVVVAADNLGFVQIDFNAGLITSPVK